jgi:hypothetical protein
MNPAVAEGDTAFAMDRRRFPFVPREDPSSNGRLQHPGASARDRCNGWTPGDTTGVEERTA